MNRDRVTCWIGLGLVLSGPLAQAARADDPPAASVVSYPRGGPARTGFFPEMHLPETPKTEWIADLGGRISGPVISGERMIIGNDRGDLIAVSLKDGSEVWAIPQPGWEITGAPVVVGDRIFCSTRNGSTAHALDDGEILWRVEIPGGAGPSPLVIAGLVIAGGNDGFVHALDAETGEERWKSDIVTGKPADPEGFDGARARLDHPARPNAPASDGLRVFVPIFDQSRIVALDLKTGKTLWSYQTRGWIGGGPTVAEGKVFVGSQDKKIYALDAATGDLVWTFETRWRADGDLAYADGSIYACASDGRCYRIDVKTGQKFWEYETEVGPDKKHFFLSGAPLVDATAVYFGSWDGHLYALNRKDGTLKWRHKPHVHGEHVGAAITDGTRLYVPLTPLFDFEKQKDKEGVHGIAVIGSENP